MADAATEALRQRVILSVPPSEPAFAALLQLIDVQVTAEVRTAAVTLGARAVLQINPQFVADHCRTDAALRTLVTHELLHVLLGHTRQFSRATPADNLAFDAIINAHVARQRPDGAHLRLFQALYAANETPWGLLRPPDGWPAHPDWAQLPAAWQTVHKRLYSEGGATYGELYALLRRQFQTVAVPLGRLLGSHDALADDGEPAQGELKKAIDAILAQWPLEELRSGRDQGGLCRNAAVARRRADRRAVQIIRGAVLRAADHPDWHGRRHPAWQASAGLLPFRTGRDSRSEALAACGEEVLLFASAPPARALQPHARVHLYMDVSGSMERFLPLVYAATAQIGELLHPQVHLFSTEIADVTAAALKSGRCQTWGGTDIACVAEHMVARDVRRAVLITDGLVGPVPANAARTLRQRRARVQAVLTHGGSREFAAGLRATCCELPAEVLHG